MSPRTLVLEIVTPDGLALRETGVDAVVVRRRESRFDPGSEIGIFPLHGPMLVRLPVAPLRYYKGNAIIQVRVEGGFAQVLDDRVLVATPGLQRPGC